MHVSIQSCAFISPEDQGEFPKRKRIGANRVAWVRAEIERWLAERMEDES